MRRTVDSMGRIVIPKSWRNDLHMDVNTQVEVDQARKRHLCGTEKQKLHFLRQRRRTDPIQ